MAETIILIAERFEEIEALTAVDLLRRAGISCRMLSVGTELAVTGRSGITVICDELLSKADLTGTDMLILPGGQPGVSNLAACGQVKDMLTAFAENGKEIAAICAAPTVPGEMGLLAGRRAACYPGLEEKLLEADVVTDREVVRDGHFTTSRGLGTAIPFALSLIETLLNKGEADRVAESIVFKCTEM